MAPRVNPYIAGNPVGGSPAFIGRETILRSVLRMLESPSENAIVLYGQRRIGKTSVLQELAQRLHVDGPYHPVYFDLQDKAALPLAQVLTELAQQLAAQLQLSPLDNWQADAPQAFRTAFIPTILDQLPPDHSLVLLFDEFDVLDNPAENQAGAAFFPYLRALLAVSPRLQFVFVIGRRPEDLSSLTLSVFKGVRTERISQLDASETERLVRLSEADGFLSWSSEAVQRVRELTGGHPFLTQQLCQEVWERADQDTPKVQAAIRAEEVEQAVPYTLRGATNALEWLWNGLGPAERIVASALASAGPQAITQEELETRLQESGVRILVGELRDAPGTLRDWDLIEPDGDGYRFRVELLRRWIAERKPLARIQQEIDFVQPMAENLFQAANAYYRAGRLEEAQPLLQQVVGLNPNHQRGNLLLVEILIARNQLAEARPLLENLYPYSPAVARPRLVQTLLLQAQGDIPEDEQLELFARILEMEPRQTEALAGHRRIWEQRGDRALKAGNLKEAYDAYQTGNLRNKTLDTGVQYIADLERIEDYEAAFALAGQLWDAFPDERTRLPDMAVLSDKKKLAWLYRQALAALDAGNRVDAMEQLVAVIGLEPRHKEATLFLHLAATGEDIVKLRAQLKQETEMRQRAERSAQEERKYRDQAEANLRARLDTETQARQRAERLIEKESQRRRPTVRELRASETRLETAQGRELSSWNPLDHLRLLSWLFVARGRLKTYKQRWGPDSLDRVGNWSATLLALSPLFIPCLAIGLGTLPRKEDAPSTALYLGLCTTLVVAALLAGLLGRRNDDWLVVVAFVVAIGVTIGLAIGLAVGVAVFVAVGMVILVAVYAAVFVAAGVANSDTAGVAFGVAIGVAVGVAIGAAVDATAGVAIGVVVAVSVVAAVGLWLWNHRNSMGILIVLSGGASGIAAGVLASSLLAGVAVGVVVGVAVGVAVGALVLYNVTSLWARVGILGALMLAYAFLIWFSFLGGWQLLA